jgi:DNA-binding SARP family transcriptional activator
MFVDILDKLIEHSEARSEYETGIAYARLALSCDRAQERAHRSLMHLLNLSGDRTGALRQYQRCCAALREELDAVPEARTTALYEEIRMGSSAGSLTDVPPTPASTELRAALPRRR